MYVIVVAPKFVIAEAQYILKTGYIVPVNPEYITHCDTLLRYIVIVHAVISSATHTTCPPLYAHQYATAFHTFVFCPSDLYHHQLASSPTYLQAVIDIDAFQTHKYILSHQVILILLSSQYHFPVDFHIVARTVQ